MTRCAVSYCSAPPAPGYTVCSVHLWRAVRAGCAEAYALPKQQPVAPEPWPRVLKHDETQRAYWREKQQRRRDAMTPEQRAAYRKRSNAATRRWLDRMTPERKAHLRATKAAGERRRRRKRREM